MKPRSDFVFGAANRMFAVAIWGFVGMPEKRFVIGAANRMFRIALCGGLLRPAPSVATPVAIGLLSICLFGRGCPAKTIWYISTLILGQ